ncbi:RNA helicase (plasmid) [Azospirillum baldaniorum]|uniref:Superfamily II DNA/RNA helicase, SNF2 family protein n=1 Tax=Azospirillum baldaniorum TaxID=1064539 RepID=A0A9P1K0I8_9PROT|nr:helicase-related protein [Azospirillum baldaniorum]AWJ94813.1 RNA helicase [Azospirillum baldaniorum]TWA69795.1 SNF2 family DNA or RNA helicase [Azospirillum brasilense]CCD03230.1 superfamily II DNA/RNA helicase, SNF2 family protein [Azospirillum baldaniorum]
MARLEDLTPNASVRGILPNGLVTVVNVQWHGSAAVELTYKTPEGKVANELLYRHDEERIEVATAGRPWSFDGDGGLFRLVSEAQRIRLAHLFDPVLAVHTSVVEPLPHQITAVYESMLPRQPLRFLLADDPGAGKTIMAGLLMKELIVRGDLQRCLVVCPGSLAEQWQDELYRRFQLPFEILTNDKLEAARTGNWFLENNLVIARLDKLSRDEDVQQKLQAPDCRWDLVVCDEAHKLSATFFGGEVKYTKRYRLGQMLSSLTRHFLLMTATPHNGKEEDFQLFMALLDGDRFEGRFRDGTHTADVSDLMRRMVKERLLKFDGKPLFPERIAYTVPYKLSDSEARLYREVSDYVREEFNRADALQNDKRAGTVGFALTILQRRLASSPEAIYQSLRRRRERLESRLREMEILQRGAEIGAMLSTGRMLDADDVEDLDDAPDNEVQAAEEEILDQATAARSIGELKIEIDTLKRLEALALSIRRSGEDKKWRELASLLSEIFTPALIANGFAEDAEPYDAGVPAIPKPSPSPRQKLVLFTEHRDTLNYLEGRITTLLGRKEAVVAIHGGLGREERKKAEEAFKHDPEVKVLLATDAAGEGINLQRAHLMVNYDLPWNPNRLEQRFGRIHRIGQTEVCHLWNLVAEETREGDVYSKLLEKLEQARRALGGQVFDVLGKLQFDGRPLRELLIDAIRYGEQPEVRARLDQVIDDAVNREHLCGLLEDGALVQDSMDVSRVNRIREEMERAEARRLQPHYIESFFMEAFRRLGGATKQREPRRYEITHVPAPIRNRDRLIGIGEPVLPRYERIAFEKELVAPMGQPLAAFVCPGHPLLDSVIDLTLERHRDLLRRGTILVDERDFGTRPRLLFTLEHAIQDGAVTRGGERRVVSKRMLYVEIDEAGTTRPLRHAPYLDFRPLKDGEPNADAILARPECAWIGPGLEAQAIGHAVGTVVPEHLAEVKDRKLALLTKTEAAVKDRLTKEITYWDHRAEQLKLQEQAGKTNANLNSGEARKRADALQARLEKRLDEIKQERQMSPLPPVVLGGLLVVPIGLLNAITGKTMHQPSQPVDTMAAAARARDIIMEIERGLGFEPTDREFEKLGYDIESRVPGTGRLRFIEVKGRVTGANTITVTRNEILTSLNKPDDFILAVVEFDGPGHRVHYIRQPFSREPDFGVTSVNYSFAELIAKAGKPS